MWDGRQLADRFGKLPDSVKTRQGGVYKLPLAIGRGEKPVLTCPGQSPATGQGACHPQCNTQRAGWRQPPESFGDPRDPEAILDTGGCETFWRTLVSPERGRPGVRARPLARGSYESLGAARSLTPSGSPDRPAGWRFGERARSRLAECDSQSDAASVGQGLLFGVALPSEAGALGSAGCGVSGAGLPPSSGFAATAAGVSAAGFSAGAAPS